MSDNKPDSQIVRRKNILFEKILNAGRVDLAAPRYLSRDVHDRGDDIAPLVGQESRGINVVHLGDVMVELDESGGGLLGRNDRERVLDLAAERGL